jgi:large subunit ribosomal protein L29
MKPSELRDMDADALSAHLAALREERFRLRFRSATEAIDNPIRFRMIRREIARIQTVLRERAAQAQG